MADSNEKQTSTGMRQKHRAKLGWIMVLIAGLAAAGFALSRRGHHSPTAAPTAPAKETDIYANYVGSASCTTCHAEAHKKWAASHHAEAERSVLTDRDRTAFDPAHTFKHGTQTTMVQWQNGVAQMASDGLTGQRENRPVARVIGEDPLRQYLIAFPGGRYQVQEAAYAPHAKEWFNVYGNEDRKPGEWGHWMGRGMNWNAMCAACHNTRVQKNYDRATDTYHTTMAETTVSCEACHGPLKSHVDWQNKYGTTGKKDPFFPKFSSERTADMCASCHARRADLTGNFVPGDSFDDHYELSTVDASDLFYPDGQIRDEDYEQSAWLGSKMQHAGLTCLNCHPRSLHMAKLRGNQLCMQCHSGAYPKAPLINPTEHSHHDAKSTGNDCANCHMPQTVYMQRHSRHDHGFTIPDPLLTKQFAIPNACNRCHTDQSADWALTKVESWYGAKMERHSRQRAQIVARARNGEGTSPAELTRLFQTEEIPYWRAVAANLLGAWLGDPQVRPVLLGGLNDPSAMVRSACIRSLAPLIDDGAVASAIKPKLNDPLRNVRIAAAWTLRASLDMNSTTGSELKHFMEINADQPTGQMQLGAFDLARGNPTQAVRAFETAAKWDPYSPGIRHELAMVLSQLERMPEAVAQLEAAVKLAPDDAEFHFKLALALNETGEKERMMAELQKAVKANPQHARAAYNLGLALHASGDPSGGIRSLLAAETADPRDPRIPYARATIHAQLGQLPEARQAAKHALELNPQFTPAAALLQQLR